MVNFVAMSEAVRQLEPQSLWGYFADLNAVPRPSKHEDRVRAWARNVGQSLGLTTEEDEVGNILIRKPATKGMENRKKVVLQSHLDMVCQKNADTEFDFMRDGIRMIINGDWVEADGTTLGADNGIGVAAICAVLASKDIPHPPIEALFTIDEETGMTGALGLKGGWLTGEVLLNLDTEDDDELSIGCAGGVDVTSTGMYKSEPSPAQSGGLRIQLSGGSGGHSGMDIHKGLLNANKQMNRLLLSLSEHFTFDLASIDGGGLRNAIPRESVAELALSEPDLTAAEAQLQAHFKSIAKEHESTDPGLQLTITRISAPHEVLPRPMAQALLLSIQACPVGIHRMSPDIADLVQTSNNLARVEVGGGQVTLQCLCRSSVDSEKEDHARSISAAFSLAGLATTYSGSYPGWTPNPNSPTTSLLRDLYVERFAEQPRVIACHAGLECGILGTNYPEMDMASFGPNIRGAHSPDERVQISSVQKFWGFFLEALARTPETTHS